MILGICNDPDVLSVIKLVKLVINIIKITIPIILIVSCMIDLFKAVVSSELNETLKTMPKRIGAAIIIFFIPMLVDILFNVLDYEKVYYPCIENATTEGINNARQSKAEALILLAKNTLLEDYYYEAQTYINKMPDGTSKSSLKDELESIQNDILAARKEREEREKNSYSKTGTYTKTELMDKDEQEVRDMTNDEFIKYVAGLAQAVYNEYGGVLPSLTIAQACYETGYGDKFEPTSHNLYGLIGYPEDHPKVNKTRKFENFYEATFYHYKYFEYYSNVYGEFLEKCKQGDAIEAAKALPSYAEGQKDYGNTVIAIIRENDLTKYDK